MLKIAENKKKELENKTDSLLARAHRQWERENLRSAFRLFLAAANLGDVTAQLDLGYFYDLGIGIRPNYSYALKWYKRAYRQGHGSAANNIGTMLRDRGNEKQALLWFERAVKLGDINANLEISKIYIRQDKQVEKAITYLRRVLEARKDLEVFESAQVEAQRLLKQLTR